MEASNSSLAIIVDLDDYGRICDFNIEFQNKIEVCDKSEPTKVKVGLELNPKTLTKNLTCGSCNAVLRFNMIVRTARARRKNRNKRKANSDVIEAELEKLKKVQRGEYEKIFEEIVVKPEALVQQDQDQSKEIPQIVQEEIIFENTPDTSVVYQCPIDECNQLFESTEDWQKHYLLRHHEGNSEINPIKVTIARSLDSTEFQDHKASDEIELVLENDDTYVKCSSCREPISQLDTVDQTNGLCYFCQFQKNQKSSSIDQTFEYSCPSCPNTFVTQHQLDIHIKANHPVYRCPVCYANFATNKALADHMRVSCKIKWINCDMCTHIAVSENEQKKHKEGAHGIII